MDTWYRGFDVKIRAVPHRVVTGGEDRFPLQVNSFYNNGSEMVGNFKAAWI
jgi:hypothetical protein